jgi:hypothetical protein
VASGLEWTGAVGIGVFIGTFGGGGFGFMTGAAIVGGRLTAAPRQQPTTHP